MEKIAHKNQHFDNFIQIMSAFPDEQSDVEYVRKLYIHANGIQSVWALFKHQIVGTHHWMSPKRLSSYLNEMARLFNLRNIAGRDRINALLDQASDRLTYNELIA